MNLKTHLTALLNMQILPIAILAIAGYFTLTNASFAQVVVETLPAENLSKSSQQPPDEVFVPRDLDFRVRSQSQPASTPKAVNYLVYVNSPNSTQLEQVKQLEPAAFMRQYQGKSVIQAGVFSQQLNATNIAKQLQSQGIATRIVNLSTGQEIALQRANFKFYFVVIPAGAEDLPIIERQVKQLPNKVPAIISQRQEPRGSHLRVGPFTEKDKAESYNRYLISTGLSNARVYYGR